MTEREVLKLLREEKIKLIDQGLYLDYLKEDPNWDIRYYLASNTKDTSILKFLSNDTNEKVKNISIDKYYLFFNKEKKKEQLDLLTEYIDIYYQEKFADGEGRHKKSYLNNRKKLIKIQSELK